jgi:hypothetical protein
VLLSCLVLAAFGGTLYRTNKGDALDQTAATGLALALALVRYSRLRGAKRSNADRNLVAVTAGGGGSNPMQARNYFVHRLQLLKERETVDKAAPTVFGRQYRTAFSGNAGGRTINNSTANAKLGGHCGCQLE